MELNESVVTTYSEYRKFRPMSIRERVRHVVLDLVSLGNICRKVEDDSVTFLAFHYLFDDQKKNFRTLVDYLSRDFQFISVSEGVNKVRAGDIKGRYICFTCDDGFSNFESATNILEDYGATACVFVCPRFINIDSADDLLFYNKDRLGGPPVNFLSWSDILRLKARGHEIGNHTFSHRNLGQLSDTHIREEIEKSDEQFQVELGECVHFACPYGNELAFNDLAVETVYNLGYKSFFTTFRGIHNATDKSVVQNSKSILFRRQHFEPHWPIRHSRYFIHR